MSRILDVEGRAETSVDDSEVEVLVAPESLRRISEIFDSSPEL